MRPNYINLILAACVLFFVAACWFRSNRSEDLPGDPVGAANMQVAGDDKQRVPNGEKNDDGDFIVEHTDDASASRYARIDREVKDEKLLEKAADKLNGALTLPNDIYLRTADCRQVNALYDPDDRSITMCYELMHHFYETFKSTGVSDEVANRRMMDAVRFVFLHEIAHALIDQYKLPVAGNEEDAADRCSAYINLKELGDEGVDAVMAAAEAFKIESKRNTSSKRNLADEHLLGEQRFYNSLCMIYGSNPAKYEDKIVAEGYLPKERAVRCEGEYQRTAESWMNLLGPWRKN